VDRPSPDLTGRARRWLLALYATSAALVTIQKGVLTHSNNFAVFRWAAVNLLAGTDLYAAHPGQHVDFFKYSPTVALLFLPFAWPPFALALLAWNLLNALLLYHAVLRLLPGRPGIVALALVYLELLLSMQYTQSNALVTASMILAFLAFERGRQLGAGAWIALGTFIKLFPLAGVALAVFHPRRWRFAVILAGLAIALAALPLVVVSPAELAAQYRSWRAIEAADTLNRGYSLMQYLYMWFGADWPNWPVQLAGTVLLLLPLALGRRRWGEYPFRLRFFCSILVYVVLFNHQSETATFVIAFTGIAIWYVSSERTAWRTAVVAAMLLAMLLHDVEIVPLWVKDQIFVPHRLKGIPCVVAWFAMQAELFATALRSESAGSALPGTAPEPRGA
jgi:glycosyl transferase family 87